MGDKSRGYYHDLWLQQFALLAITDVLNMMIMYVFHSRSLMAHPLTYEPPQVQ